MYLKLLDIDAFITKNNIGETSSSKLYSAKNKINPQGLFSEEIFGRLGSRQRRMTFGYVSLKCKIIHPEVYPIITSINTDLTKLILNKAKYIIDDKGLLIANDLGESGINFFITNFDKISFKNLKTEKPEQAVFITKNAKKVFIDKLLLLPAGIRDIQISKTTEKITVQFSDITSLYEKLLRQTAAMTDDLTALPLEYKITIIENIQRACLDINDWIKSRIEGKTGIIRGGLLRKSTDYSGRLVISPDPNLPLGSVGIPWQIVLKLHEPFTMHEIIYKNPKCLDLIKAELGIDHIDTVILKRFITRVNNEPDQINFQLKLELIEVAKTIIKDRVIGYKRDPVEDRNSWGAYYVRVDDTGHTLKINPYDCTRHGGD